jgi:hypothetical protein
MQNYESFKSAIRKTEIGKTPIFVWNTSLVEEKHEG